MSDIIQFDTSEIVVGGVNIAEAICTEKDLIFNESYTVVGKSLKAPSIYACYDLTILGDLEVTEIEVRGNLFVTGNIKATQISCLKSIICSGNIFTETVVGNEIIANDITCQRIISTGNIVARTTIDISESLKTEKSVMTGEGILGSGQFDSQGAIAVEYFNFDGRVLGKVIELETDSEFGEPHSCSQNDEDLTEFAARTKERILKELQKAGEVDENELVNTITRLSGIDDNMLSDWKLLSEYLVELSYLDRITNFRDYLFAIMAKKILPKEITGYETIEHVFGKMLVNINKELDSLPFHAKNVEEFAYALKIIVFCEKEINMEKDEALDRVFQSVGIKYKTVKAFLGK